MNYAFEANIIRSLGKIIEKGHLSRGDKPVHWCLDCKSALAEAEVEYQDKTSTSIDFIFLPGIFLFIFTGSTSLS